MIKIGILGSEYFRDYTEQIKANRVFQDVSLSYISTAGADNFIKLARQAEDEGFHALVSGPHDYARLSPHLGTPCYVVHPNISDFLSLHNKIPDYETLAVIFPHQVDLDFTILQECLHVRYHKFYYHNSKELERLLQRLKKEGYTTVISNNFASEKARSLGMSAHYYYSQKSIEDAIGNAIQILKNLERENQYATEIRSILENTLCGVISAAGENAQITYVNNTALAMLKKKQAYFLYKPLESFIPQQTVSRALKQNEPEENIQLSLLGVDVIGNILPLQLPGAPKNILFLFENTARILEYETMIRRKIKQERFGTHYSFEDIIGDSSNLKKTIMQAKRFACSDSTILINAETGAGKEVFAQSIHAYSPRKDYPFVAINCASVPDTLIESELFGYAPGSFTGASSKGKSGLIELANHGTVFLDDIDAFSPSFQAKLLRVMQEREIIRIGGERPIPIDVRFIVATNRNLKKLVEDGEFRNDLYFRINVLRFSIPPLRDRPEDIIPLYRHYLNRFNQTLYETIQDDLQSIFAPALSCSYPGNIRELISVAERFVALVDHSQIHDSKYLSALVAECLDTTAPPSDSPASNIHLDISGDYSEDLLSAKRELLNHYIQTNQGNVSQLAKDLGISRATLYNRLRELGIHTV